MRSKQITLSTGDVVTVYLPPNAKIYQMVQRMYPDPVAPVRTAKGAAGNEISMSILDDPEYLKEKARMRDLRRDKEEELNALYALKDIKVPDEFDVDAEYGFVARMADADWTPREGVDGRRLDYIEWVVTGNIRDAAEIQKALAELSGVDMGVVDSIEDSFRSNVAGT